MDEKSGEDVDLQVAQVVLYTNPSCGWVLAPFLKDFGSGRFHAPSLYALEQPYSQVKPKTSKEASTSQKTISDFEVVEDMDFPKEAFEALVTGSGLFPMHNQAVDSNSRDASTGLSWTEYGSMLGLSAFTIDHGSENGDYPRNINDIIPDDGSPIQDIPTLFNQLFTNPSSKCIDVSILDKEPRFFIPPQSTWLMSDVSYLKPLINHGPYSLILMDPPWPNLSVKRSKEYSFMSDMYDLFKIPLKRLVSPGSLVAVWITNHPKVYDFVKRRLFPDWGLELEGEWTWIKVTRKGELVLPLIHRKHRRPYERLIIGRVKENRTKKESHDQAISSQDIRQSSSFVSIPSRRHSQKPFVHEILASYCDPTGPQRYLELFARNLYPGWTSWGNEPLQNSLSRDFTKDGP